VWSEVQTLPLADIEAIMADLRAGSEAMADSPPHRLMTKEEVRSIASSKIQFGSHALNHASLPSLTKSEKSREIRDSVQACEDLAGARPVTFAYPFGDHDEESEALVREAGYECACAAEGGAVRPESPLFALPRLQVGNWTSRALSKALRDL
jgi:peptidoglycan/xylan/chitin deacetylase (PgdA/CDA1 family)